MRFHLPKPLSWWCSVVAVAVLFGLAPAPANSISAQARSASIAIDCSKSQSSIEVSICKDPQLLAGDSLMATLFGASRISAFGKGPSNELSEQRKWLKERATACGGQKGSDQIVCLRRLQDERNDALAVAALFKHPDLSLKTLHQLDPSTAPLIEAVYLYANGPQGADWESSALASERGQLLLLLRPYAERFQSDRDLSFGRDILKDEHIASAEDALKSEKSFASFVQIASAYISDGSVQSPVPCEAFVRRPKLAAMVGPVFGSTLDNMVVSSDCPGTLPPTPNLTRLIDMIRNSWPECEGTIRFFTYRTFVQSVDSALLATEAQLPKRMLARIPRLGGVPVENVQASIAELTTYYEQFDRASSARAPALAKAMVHDIIVNAHRCD